MLNYHIDWPCHNDEQEFRYMDLLSQEDFQERMKTLMHTLFAEQLQLPIPSFDSVSMAEMMGEKPENDGRMTS